MTTAARIHVIAYLARCSAAIFLRTVVEIVRVSLSLPTWLITMVIQGSLCPDFDFDVLRKPNCCTRENESAPDSVSHGAYCGTALPQVLLANYSTF
jgi:hypothetical protein